MTNSTVDESSTIRTFEALDMLEAPITPETVSQKDDYHHENRWQTMLPHALQAFYMHFVSGMNDGNMGIILPSLRIHYGLTQYVVSIIFLCMTLGYFIAAATNGYLIQKTSQAKTALIGGVSMGLAYIVLLFAVPFPAMCISMVFLGIGMALMQSCSNVVCGEMPRGTIILNFLHACYGLGALIGPLLAAAILERQMPWAVTYMVLCGLQWSNVISMVFTLRNLKTRAEREQEEQQQLSEEDLEERKRKNDNGTMLAAVVRTRIACIGAIFLLLYVGVETVVGNYGYTFLITVRSTDTVAMAHLISGYWGGLCAGRLFLGYMTLKFGEKPTTYVYLTVIVAMMLVFWFVPVVGANAAALAIMGVALGPLYPTVVALTNKVVPPRLYAVTIGFLSAFGSGGSALFPYLTGIIIGIRGVQALMPLCVAMAIALLVIWVFIPNPARKPGGKHESGMEDVARASSASTATISTRYRGGRNT